MPSPNNKRRSFCNKNLKTHKNKGPSQGQNATAITSLFWNAGGLSISKFCEFKTVLTRESADVFAIVEAGASTDSLNFYKSKGYVLYSLPRSRQIASGIIVGAKSSITVKFKLLHKMQDNKFEAVELNLWKNNTRTKFIFAYNPPGNTPLTKILDNAIDKNTIIIGDFNCHSKRWGYRDTDSQGKALEDFLDSSPMSLLLCSGHTFLSFKGEKTNPDLALAHTKIATKTSLNLLESCTGYGHRILCVKRFCGAASSGPIQDSLPRWNLKKADWLCFSHLTDTLLTPDLIVENNINKSYDAISETIRIIALETIPRGKARNYKPFWTVELASLKVERDKARQKAELTGDSADSIALRRAQATLK